MKNLLFVIPLPPPINQTYKTTLKGGFYKSEKAKEWEKEAGWEIKSQKGKQQKVSKKTYTVDIIYYLTRDRDIDSSIKILFDLLQKQQIIQNDRLITNLYATKRIVKKDPHVEITIS